MKQLALGLGLTLACTGVIFSQTPALPSPVFSAGSPISAAEMNANFAALLQSLTPIGTVIASFVPPDAGGNYMSGPTGNVWAFADGSKPSGTDAYTWVFPDMRGQFIRGMNVSGGVDPDIRTVGSVQGDTFQGHAHKWINQYGGDSGPIGSIGTSTSATNSDNANIGTMTIVADGVNGSPRNSNETRPDNIAVYWYIKVR